MSSSSASRLVSSLVFSLPCTARLVHVPRLVLPLSNAEYLEIRELYLS